MAACKEMVKKPEDEWSDEEIAKNRVQFGAYAYILGVIYSIGYEKSLCSEVDKDHALTSASRSHNNTQFRLTKPALSHFIKAFPTSCHWVSVFLYKSFFKIFQIIISKIIVTTELKSIINKSFNLVKKYYYSNINDLFKGVLNK